jgi:hypothetical protein
VRRLSFAAGGEFEVGARFPDGAVRIVAFSEIGGGRRS